MSPPRSLPERFWAKVDKRGPDECWLWTAGLNQGYGSIRLGHRGSPHRPAHRIAYEMLVGLIPSGLDLDHLCRVKACVNPAHLEPVTRSENVRRQHAAGSHAGAANRAKTHCPQGHAYDDENTYWRGAQRSCRACSRERSSAFKRRSRQH